MSELDSAALMFGGATLAFLLLAFAIRLWRRPRPERAAPTAFQMPKPPRLRRKAKADEAPIEIAPARLARIGRKEPIAPPTHADPAPEADPAIEPDPAPIEDVLEAMASDVERQAHGAARGNAR